MAKSGLPIKKGTQADYDGMIPAPNILYITTDTNRLYHGDRLLSSDATNHANLENLAYAASGHTGFVPDTRTVNSKALSANITLNAADVGARASTWMPTAADVGAVPTSRTVNSKALSANITINAADVNAFPLGRDNVIPAGANLNDYTEPGVWYISSGNVPTLQNAPPYSDTGFRLEVLHTGDTSHRSQVASCGVNRIYRRWLQGDNWGGWALIPVIAPVRYRLYRGGANDGDPIVQQSSGTAGQVLESGGSDSAPAWRNKTGTNSIRNDMGLGTGSGALAIANGGTGMTSYTANRILITNGAGTAITHLDAGTTSQYLRGNADGLASWATFPTIPAAANNGTLTLQLNGVTSQTFSANQSESATFNVSRANLGIGVHAQAASLTHLHYTYPTGNPYYLNGVNTATSSIRIVGISGAVAVITGNIAFTTAETGDKTVYTLTSSYRPSQDSASIDMQGQAVTIRSGGNVVVNRKSGIGGSNFSIAVVLE